MNRHQRQIYGESTPTRLEICSLSSPPSSSLGLSISGHRNPTPLPPRLTSTALLPPKSRSITTFHGGRSEGLSIDEESLGYTIVIQKENKEEKWEVAAVVLHDELFLIMDLPTITHSPVNGIH
ncbi:hypothetical protein Bca4012_020255 [Brassica carinata]|uniref:Uncharacterized protein n=1 Tax=Brassica carinata TaxID=52824 RepID=A0A8X7WIC5_BRACI|nr:hypothetical protein Bca52824_001336 [Brassica carinata]